MSLSLSQLERLVRSIRDRLPLIVSWTKRSAAPRLENQQIIYWVDTSDPRNPRMVPLTRFGPNTFRPLGTTRAGYHKVDPDNPHYEIIGTGLGSFRAESAAPATVQGIGTGDLKAYDFAGGADQDLHFSAQLPHGYREGSNLTPRIKWAPDSTNTGTVIFNLEYVWYCDDCAFPDSASTVSITVNADGTQEVKHDLFEAIDGSDKEAGSILLCRIEREGTTDTYADDVYLLGLDFIYERDSFGSDEKEAKTF
jgi:hypothetical protein